MNEVTGQPENPGGAAVGASVGSRLKAAREAQGVSIDEVSQSLKFNSRQIEAMERDDFASLRDPVIMRGFVRNYARYLHLDQVSVLEQLEQQVGPIKTELTPAPSLSVPATSSRPQMIMPLAVLGILAVLGGIFALNKFAPDTLRPPAQPRISGTQVPNTPPPEEKVAKAPPAPAPEAVPAVPVAAAPAPVAPGSTPESAATSAAVPSMAGMAPVGAVPAAGMAGMAPPGLVAPVTALGGKGLSFSFKQEAWIQVKGKDGKTLYQKLHKAGESQVVDVAPPFSMVVGNAPGVEVALDGKPVDLVASTKGTVAKLTLQP